MAKEWTDGFYKSKAWRQCRASFIASRISMDGGVCQRCHAELGYIVHHKIELTPDNISDPDISLSHSNLMYLCHNCHNTIHGKEPDRYMFGPDGEVVPPLKKQGRVQ